ncbi:hypothetical protein [Flavobacterium aquidurense]|uniref:hypothetical protein n=1 Tax=Flavobacterium aquidurense TaxID=362413 RepID=UPI0028666837|nr:hypothetical protein [Flavobacterium aquidurense]MDR7369992.1 hypothetical protein [Flavobacterium aquidurense]
MEKVIRLRVFKDLSSQQQIDIIKLKGSLISKGYTAIIHINDQDEEYHINSFAVIEESRSAVQDFIEDFINKAELTNMVSILNE